MQCGNHDHDQQNHVDHDIASDLFFVRSDNCFVTSAGVHEVTPAGFFVLGLIVGVDDASVGNEEECFGKINLDVESLSSFLLW